MQVVHWAIIVHTSSRKRPPASHILQHWGPGWHTATSQDYSLHRITHFTGLLTQPLHRITHFPGLLTPTATSQDYSLTEPFHRITHSHSHFTGLPAHSLTQPLHRITHSLTHTATSQDYSLTHSYSHFIGLFTHSKNWNARRVRFPVQSTHTHTNRNSWRKRTQIQGDLWSLKGAEEWPIHAFSPKSWSCRYRCLHTQRQWLARTGWLKHRSRIVGPWPASGQKPLFAAPSSSAWTCLVKRKVDVCKVAKLVHWNQSDSRCNWAAAQLSIFCWSSACKHSAPLPV